MTFSNPPSRVRRASPTPQPATGERSSFFAVDSDQLERHLARFQYGSFELTEAIRPSYDLKVVPRQGFRQDSYQDASGDRIPVVMAAATRPGLFDLFIDMLAPLGEVLDVVLETSHDGAAEHRDLVREHIDAPVLKSVLYEFEELLLNDGCTGIAVLNPRARREVQLDEHKLVIGYGSPLEQYERVLISHDVYPDESIRFITEAEHVHSSTDDFARQFETLCMRLGIDI